jgi:tripartite-type tricarboxylate transporter receptor subunit TctC
MIFDFVGRRKVPVMKLMMQAFLLAATLIGTGAGDAAPQAYPSRPVRVVVGFAAGGGIDVTARLMCQWLSEYFGQQFIVENRPGAGSNIATEAVVSAPPDGYTLLLVSSAHAIGATLYENLSFNFIRDITPVAGITRQPQVMLANPLLPAKTVPEFIAYAKANPGKVSMASGGTGAASHMSGELFKMMTGVAMVHVPYRGAAQALTDVIGGQVEIMFESLPASIEHIRAGKLRALAVSTAARSEALPDTPALGDFVPGFEASTWFGVGAPKNTPSEIIDSLNKAINAGLIDPKLKARFSDLGSMPFASTPSDFGKLIAEEIEKWGKVIKSAGIKP